MSALLFLFGDECFGSCSQQLAADSERGRSRREDSFVVPSHGIFVVDAAARASCALNLSHEELSGFATNPVCPLRSP